MLPTPKSSITFLKTWRQHDALVLHKMYLTCIVLHCQKPMKSFHMSSLLSFQSISLMGQRHEFFRCRFFHKSSYPKTLKIALGHFDIFRKFAEIFASQVAPPASKIPAVNLCTLSFEYLREFSKKIEMALMENSGARGNWLGKKNLK